MLNFLERLVDHWYALLPRRVPTAAQAREARIIAHRGAHDKTLGIQENTNAAFAKAFALGCWGIEFDVHASADGILVVNHDPTLQRLWNKNLSIAQCKIAELRTAAPLLPTLEEVVAKYGTHMHLCIELKEPFTAIKTLTHILSALEPAKDFHLLSLDEHLLSNLSKIFPKEALVLVPMQHNTAHFCKLSLQKHYGGVAGHYVLLRQKYVQQLAEANQCVGVGFIDSQYSLYRELNRGVRHLFTNNAAALTQHLKEIS